MEVWTILADWAGAQPLFFQIFLGLLLFFLVYTAGSIALVALLLGTAWLMRSVARRQQVFARGRPMSGAYLELASWLVHVLGATLLVWFAVHSFMS